MPAIFLDSSVLIQYFRNIRKNDSFYLQILNKYKDLYISSIAKAEIFSYAADNVLVFWSEIFESIEVFPFTDNTIIKTREIVLQLKRKSMVIELADMMIAATAIENDLPLATINQNHFERIDGLEIVTPELL
jgi:predicted nucleic acid-binding protein